MPKVSRPPAATCAVRGLLGQRDRMPRVRRDYGGAQLDAAGLHPGHGDDGEHIGAKVLRQPVAVEPIFLGGGNSAQSLRHIPHKLQSADKQPNTHGGYLLRRSYAPPRPVAHGAVGDKSSIPRDYRAAD